MIYPACMFHDSFLSYVIISLGFAYNLMFHLKEQEPWCKKYMELYEELRENWERLYWDEGYSKKHGQERASYDSAEDDDEDFSPYRFLSSGYFIILMGCLNLLMNHVLVLFYIFVGFETLSDKICSSHLLIKNLCFLLLFLYVKFIYCFCFAEGDNPILMK